MSLTKKLKKNGAAALAAGLLEESTSNDSSSLEPEQKTEDYETKYNALRRKYKQLKTAHKASLEEQLKKSQTEITKLKARVAELERNAEREPYDSFPVRVAAGASKTEGDTDAGGPPAKFLSYNWRV